MTSRRQARRQAVDILYQADVTGDDPIAVAEEWEAAGRAVEPFARELVSGVVGHDAEIHQLLARYAEDWTVERMAAVDRTILRVATFELLHRPDVPPAAAIDEAVSAAKELSTEDSGRFVNGILGRVAREAIQESNAPPG